MLGLFLNPFRIDCRAASDARSAYRALADAAIYYLNAIERAVSSQPGIVPPCVALNSRVRGTGPGVAFGDLVRRIEELEARWQCPFEGSENVAGAELPASKVLGDGRDDGFLLLKFQPNTLDLPLHIHEDSDRFIYIIGGRGFFHVCDQPLDAVDNSSLRHVPARDRDVIMLRRGTVHTFSTAESPLYLLSYHRPFISIDSAGQYRVGSPPRFASEFLKDVCGDVSFDAGWNSLTAPGNGKSNAPRKFSTGCRHRSARR